MRSGMFSFSFSSPFGFICDSQRKCGSATVCVRPPETSTRSTLAVRADNLFNTRRYVHYPSVANWSLKHVSAIVVICVLLTLIHRRYRQLMAMTPLGGVHQPTIMLPVSLTGSSQLSDSRVIATTKELWEKFPFNGDMGGGDIWGVGTYWASVGYRYLLLMDDVVAELLVIPISWLPSTDLKFTSSHALT